jgi:CRISPR-associated DxTHG motif protein
MSELLIIAPIGDPTAWNIACYRIEGEKHITECTTNCSSIALLLHFSREYSSITLLLQTIDAILCSRFMDDGSRLEKSADSLKDKLTSDRGKIAERLKEDFEKRLKEAATKAKVMKKGGEPSNKLDNIIVKEDLGRLTINDCAVEINVGVSQSAGEYTVMRPGLDGGTIYFKGEPTAVFAKIFNDSLSIISKRSSIPDICLDLTHGMNYLQAMAIYAVEVLKSLYETNVKIINFSPYPRKKPSQEKPQPMITSGTEPVKGSDEPPPTLVELDVSDLIKISELASNISNMILSEEGVKTIRESVKKFNNNPNLQKFSRHVTLAWYYMSMGVITLAYYHLYQASLRVGQVRNLLREEEDGELNVSISDGKVIVEYSRPRSWYSAIPLIVWLMYNRLRSFFDEDTLSLVVPHATLRNAVRLIKEKKAFYSRDEIVLDAEIRNIQDRYRRINKIIQELSASKPILNSIIPKQGEEREFPSDNVILRTLIRAPLPDFLIKSILDILSSTHQQEHWKLLKEIRENLGDKVRFLQLLSEQDRDMALRHLISHVGLTYEPLKSIIIREQDQDIHVLLKIDPGKLGDDPLNAWLR